MPLPTVSEVDLAYIAGLFDGEGSIIAKKDTRRGNAYRASVTNTNREVLVWICELLGYGRVYTHSQGHAVWKDSYVLFIMGLEHIKDFLDAIRPYVKVKRDALEIMSALVDRRLSLQEKQYNHPTTDLDAMLVEAMHKVNRRGK